MCVLGGTVSLVRESGLLLRERVVVVTVRMNGGENA